MTRNKKRLISVLLVLVMTVAMLPSAFAVSTSDFKDVKPDGWYISAINYAVTKGLFEGTSGTTFEPDTTMTKGMFVTVLSRMAGADTTNVPSAGLSDIAGSEWYAGPANWAAGNGYAIRNENNQFRPDEPIAREEIADILTNYFTKTNTSTGTPTETVDAFADADKVSDWAVNAVEFMRSTGLMTGDENFNFNPQQNITRAEAATVFMRIGERIGFEGKADDLFGWVEFKENECYEMTPSETYAFSEDDYLTDAVINYLRDNRVRYVEDYPGWKWENELPYYRYMFTRTEIDKALIDTPQTISVTITYSFVKPNLDSNGNYVLDSWGTPTLIVEDIDSRTYPVTIVVRKGEPGSERGEDTDDWATASSKVTEAFIRTLNADRIELGLNEVTVAPQDVMDYAVLRAEELATLFGHTRPNGEWYYDGLNYWPFVENAFEMNGKLYGARYTIQHTADIFYDAWCNSQGHYDAMMNPEISKVAIGIYYDGTHTYAIMHGVE